MREPDFTDTFLGKTVGVLLLVVAVVLSAVLSVVAFMIPFALIAVAILLPLRWFGVIP